MTDSSAKSEPIVDENGTKSWRNEAGQFHRPDGPAIEYSNGSKCWFIDGKYHRTDGPAIEYPNGNKSWFIDGKRHRADGPAIEWSNGTKEWYIDGKEYSEAEYIELRCSICARIDCPTKN